MADEVTLWLNQAERDLVSAENSLKSKDYYASAFWSHQAAEKSLKSLYIKKNQSLIKVHDLVRLGKEVFAPQEILLKCSQINPVYLKVRYPDEEELPSESVTEQQASLILRLAREIIAWVKKNL